MYSCTTHVPLDFYLDFYIITQINLGNPTFLLNVSKSISFLILFFLNSIKNWIIQQTKFAHLSRLLRQNTNPFCG